MSTHIYKDEQQERATSRDSLDTRLRINKAYGSADFDGWLFEHLAVKAGEDVLDVGCGTGAQSLRFAELVQPGGTVSALDLSEDSVRQLNEALAPDAPVEAVVSDMGAIEDLIRNRFTTKTYDLAHSSYALYYSEKREHVLDVMKNALKPGGRLAVFSPNGKHGLVDLATELGPVPEEITDCMSFGPRVLDPWFNAHLADVETHHFHNELRIPTAEEVMTFYRATTYFRDDVEPEFRRAVESEIAEHGCFEYEKNGFLIVGRAAA